MKQKTMIISMMLLGFMCFSPVLSEPSADDASLYRNLEIFFEHLVLDKPFSATLSSQLFCSPTNVEDALLKSINLPKDKLTKLRKEYSIVGEFFRLNRNCFLPQFEDNKTVSVCIYPESDYVYTSRFRGNGVENNKIKILKNLSLKFFVIVTAYQKGKGIYIEHERLSYFHMQKNGKLYFDMAWLYANPNFTNLFIGEATDKKRGIIFRLSSEMKQKFEMRLNELYDSINCEKK